MPVEITYFVHGTTTDNEQEISSGWKDVDLSQKAVDQSNGAFPIIQESRLRECNYGDFNGKPSEIVEPMQEKCVAIVAHKAPQLSLDVLLRGKTWQPGWQYAIK